MLAVKNLSLKYGEIEIFKNLSFSLEEGEILGISGANGSGKSSLCLALSGHIEKDDDKVSLSGEVKYDGKHVEDLSVAERCHEMGIVFQNPDNQLFSPQVVEEIAFAPANLCVERAEIYLLLEKSMKQCGIEHLKNKSTNALSGGEKQLVAIAAVLSMQPKILIADEITARIDIERKQVIRDILCDFASGGGSVIVVSHNPRDIEIATKVIKLEKGKDYADYIIEKVCKKVESKDGATSTTENVKKKELGGKEQSKSKIEFENKKSNTEKEQSISNIELENKIDTEKEQSKGSIKIQNKSVENGATYEN